MKKLVGCINKLGDVIKTRYFYINSETKEIKDVTLELCRAIDSFNERARQIRQETDKYSMIIPYKYNDGCAEYSFGCGLAHYLQEEVFGEIVTAAGELSFSLVECKLEMLTPNDVKHILKCKNAFDKDIEAALLVKYCI